MYPELRKVANWAIVHETSMAHSWHLERATTSSGWSRRTQSCSRVCDIHENQRIGGKNLQETMVAPAKHWWLSGFNLSRKKPIHWEQVPCPIWPTSVPVGVIPSSIIISSLAGDTGGNRRKEDQRGDSELRERGATVPREVPVKPRFVEGTWEYNISWGVPARHEITPLSLVGFFQGRSHRSKWMMTRGTPMTLETTLCVAALRVWFPEGPSPSCWGTIRLLKNRAKKRVAERTWNLHFQWSNHQIPMMFIVIKLCQTPLKTPGPHAEIGLEMSSLQKGRGTICKLSCIGFPTCYSLVKFIRAEITYQSTHKGWLKSNAF